MAPEDEAGDSTFAGSAGWRAAPDEAKRRREEAEAVRDAEIVTEYKEKEERWGGVILPNVETFGAAIASGSYNFIDEAGARSSILAGDRNTVDGPDSCVLSGRNNSNWAVSAAILAGESCVLDGRLGEAQ